jgi:flavorubredoxin
MADEPLLFHCGYRGMFESIRGAIQTLMPIEKLRWISFSHLEGDESGAMNLWQQAAPHAQVAHGKLGCDVSLNDLSLRMPRALEDNEVLDLGGKRVRYLATPHAPHGWDAGLMYEENGVLLCGDILDRRATFRRWRRATSSPGTGR